jgi:hypothetical protein
MKLKDTSNRLFLLVGFCAWLGLGVAIGSEEERSLAKADGRVVGPDDPQKGCIKCHDGEVRAWEKTTHFDAYDALDGSEHAEEILENLGLDDYAVESNRCQSCHVTMYAELEGDEPEGKWGISCESCHGPASSWVDVHQDYGKDDAGAKITPEERAKETAEHRRSRVEQSIAHGMIRPENIYNLASNCLECHTVPDPELVDLGGHTAGSEGFELVAWSQGQVRHNFLHGGENEAATPERLRVLYVVGKVVDLEFSLRALSKAKEDGDFAQSMTARVAAVRDSLAAIEGAVGETHAAAIGAIRKLGEGLGVGDSDALTAAADGVRASGMALAAKLGDGADLEGISALLPDPSTYVVEKRAGR